MSFIEVTGDYCLSSLDARPRIIAIPYQLQPLEKVILLSQVRQYEHGEA